MKILIFSGLLLLGLAASAPTSDKVIVTRAFFPSSNVVYTSTHDIVKLHLPLNHLNFEEDSDDSDEDASVVFFFLEADIKPNGDKDYKGLYRYKTGNVTKILENGRSFDSTAEATKVVYFATTDGIYAYDAVKDTAEKYGTMTDSLIDIAKVKNQDLLYVVTVDKEVYKVSENGTKKEKVDEIPNAEQIVLDDKNNLYFVGSDKKVYIVQSGAASVVNGLPEKAKNITLLRPAFVLENSVPVVLDSQVFIVYSNGTTELSDFELRVNPSAYAIEGTLVQYYAFEKKIYEYNLLVMILGETFKELKGFFDEVKDDIETIRSKPKLY